MKNIYTELAAFYDRLNGEVDYDKWAAFIAGALEEHGIVRGSTIVDAGCGTGQITVRLAKAGYDMIGVDISPEMLSVAQSYADSERVRPLFVCQDISSLDLYGSVKGAISTLDSLNYLTKKEDLASFFSCMKNYIEKDGVLIFDLNTKYKFEKIYGDRDYIIEEDGVYCGWENHYSPSTRIATFVLSIFEETPDGKYTRHNELQRERYYSDRTVIKLLEENGFETEAIYSDVEGAPANTSAEGTDLRHFFVCRKKR